MTVVLLFLTAFLVRLINLNQSLWLDESIVAKVVRTIPFHLIPSQLSPSDVHPPLYYMFISFWSNLFGTSEVALRFPSVIFSLITGWMVYKIGTHLRDKKTGLWAAAFFLFNPLIIYYSQEARMHMMATMLLSITLYNFLQLINEIQAPNSNSPLRQGSEGQAKSKIKNIILFNVFSALSMGVFYGSGFFIGAMITVGFFILPQKKYVLYLIIGLLTSLFILSPLLYQQIRNSQTGLAELTNWSRALGNVDIKNIGLIFLKFATGRLSWLPKWSYYGIAGIPTLLVWVLVVLGMKKNKLFTYLFILPLLFGMIVSLFAPMMMYFRFLYLIPVMSFLLVFAVIPSKEGIQSKIFDTKKSNYSLDSRLRGNDKVLYVIISLFIIFSFVYLFIPLFHREDWKSLTKQLNKNIPLYMIVPSSDPISYYRSDVNEFELRNVGTGNLPETMYVVPYTSDLYGLNYVEQLQKQGCITVSSTRFRGDLLLQTWKCLRNS